MKFALLTGKCAARPPRRIATVLALVAISGASLRPVNAQDAPEVGTNALQEVVVTGSRIARRDYQSDSPIVTIQADALKNSSPVTVDQQLDKLPQFASSALSGEVASGAVPGASGAATLNLRNLGDNRNLVLLDGRRMEPSTNSFAVDVNTIPASLVDSVEVITGGASAAYGSDAISGVVNFKLKRHFEGVELDVKGGASQRGDYGNFDGTLTLGTNFAENRGNIVVAVGYTDRQPTFNRDIPFYQRGYAAGTSPQEVSFLPTGYYSPLNETIVATPFGAIPNFAFPGGLAAPPVTQAQGFNPNHTLFNVATGAGYAGGLYPQTGYAVGPGGGIVYNSDINGFATIPLKRENVFTRFEYEFNDVTSVYGQVLYTHYDSTTRYIPPVADNFWVADVPRDGRYEPPELTALLNERLDPGAAWPLGRMLTFVGEPQQQNTNDVSQYLLGLNGRLPVSDWTWDLYGSYGYTSVQNIQSQGYVSTTRYRTLISAPNYGAGFSDGVGGKCTSGISPFISQSAITPDCIAYLSIVPKDSTTMTQDVIEGSTQGKLLDLPAGELRFAAGVDYRRNALTADIDSDYQANPNISIPPGVPGVSDVVTGFSLNSSQGASDVYEVYSELLLPILKDLPLVKSLDLDAGYRYSQYQLAGGVNTYKITMNWRMDNAVSFRGGYERAVRAPNVLELFNSPQLSLSFALDPCVNAGPLAIPPGAYGNNSANSHQAQVQALCQSLSPGAPAGLYDSFSGSGTPTLIGQSRGNSNLAPERADTYTAGIVVRPTDLPWGASLSTSLDYYRVDLDGAIQFLTPSQSYALCFNQDGRSNPAYSPLSPFCTPILRTALGLQANVANLYENQGGVKTQGIDLQMDAGLPVGPGRINVNGQVSYLIDYKRSLVSGEPFVDYAGSIDASAGGLALYRWRSLLTTGYNVGSFAGGLRWKFLPATRDVSCVTSPTCSPPTGAYYLFDLFATYRFKHDIEMGVGVDNLLNRQPPISQGTPGITSLGEYDIVGRAFWANVSVKF